VEHWNPFARIRVDLFGFIDILAIRDKEMLAVQCTTMDHRADRVAKMNASPLSQMWVSTGARLECWGWRKLKSSNRWEVGKVVF